MLCFLKVSQVIILSHLLKVTIVMNTKQNVPH